MRSPTRRAEEGADSTADERAGGEDDDDAETNRNEGPMSVRIPMLPPVVGVVVNVVNVVVVARKRAAAIAIVATEKACDVER